MATTGNIPIGADGGILISAGGGAVPVSQPGLGGGILTTWTAVLTTATATPASALTNRKAMLVQAWEGNALPIFVGESTITARVLAATPGAHDGIMLLPGQSYPDPLGAGVTLYTRATATGCYVGTREEA